MPHGNVMLYLQEADQAFSLCDTQTEANDAQTLMNDTNLEESMQTYNNTADNGVCNHDANDWGTAKFWANQTQADASNSNTGYVTADSTEYGLATATAQASGNAADATTNSENQAVQNAASEVQQQASNVSNLNTMMTALTSMLDAPLRT